MAEPEASDVAGTGEQDFKEGMQRAADDHDDADKDIDNKLDFAEFCDLVRGREEGDIPEDELKTRFELLDADGTGKIEMSEYLLWSLKDCLARASQRIIDLFKAWDEDNSGTVDSAEFYKAVKALGFAVDREDTDAVFKALDTDKSGSVDYRELNERLRAGIGSELAKRNLKRAPPKPDRSRTAKLNAKNVNMNYTTSRIAVLPATVKLDASSGEPIQVQLKNILTESGAKLVDLFTEWDTDGNGGLDKKEWRQGIAALGYDAPQADIDAVFDGINGNSDGFIEFSELKVGLSGARVELVKKEAALKRQKTLESDVAGTGEQEFGEGMQRAAKDHDDADADIDNKLDFEEFCSLVRSREEGDHQSSELRMRFEALDVDGTGKVDMNEYLIWSLKDCLARASTRLIDIFRKWDEDGDGNITKDEFYRAIKALGFVVEQEDTDAVFKLLDEDRSGSIQYKELNDKLRQGVGSELAKRKLKRAPPKGDFSRTSKLNAKNVNMNYTTARVAALPETVKLDASSGVVVQEQLRTILHENNVKLMDLFQEWDEDGNGGLDKKEFRKGIAALGYDAPKKDIDAIYESINGDGNGFIEFDELKLGLSKARASLAQDEATDKKKRALKKEQSALASDVAGTGEQEFGEGMQRAADDHDDADKDIDNKLDFEEFCSLVRGREEGVHKEEELKSRFEALDADGTGKIEMSEYLTWSLKDCLARASTRLIDIFRKWDEDRSGTVDHVEFYRAIKALGFPVRQSDTDAVFKLLDEDKSGSLEYKELNERLRAGVGADLTKRKLKRAPVKGDRSRTAKLNAKNNDANYVTAAAAVLPETVKLDAKSGKSVTEQLREILKKHSVKLIDLFREWDDDGNGGLDKTEFRKGIYTLGYEVKKKDIDAIFDGINDDNNKYIEFGELKVALSDTKAKQDEAAAELKRRKTMKKQKQDGALASDVAGTGEQEFGEGMQRSAEDHDRADKDMSNTLDFEEYCILVKAREEGIIPEAELKQRFALLDDDGDGFVDMKEYLMWSLKDCLARASTRLIDLFRKWDEDKSGTVDRVEFYRAIKALGFPVEQEDTDAVFTSLDEDKSGSLEYAELNEKLRAGVGAELTKRRLKRAPTQKDKGRLGKLSAKNVNQNYVVAHVAALGETVKLDSKSGKPITEQLRDILQKNSVALIDLFREWDDDGNGGLDKKEFRKGIAALGYEAPKKDIDRVFAELDEDAGGNGFIEFAELKVALTDKRIKAKQAEAKMKEKRASKKGSKKALASDVAGTGEQDFNEGMQRAADDHDDADKNIDNKLDFEEFCVLVRGREEGDIPEDELKTRFAALDADGDGWVDMAEYLTWSLKDCLARSSQRLVDLFSAWDEDKSGTVDAREFYKAIKSLGFPVDEEDTNAVFKSLDEDKSGSLEYKELNERLRAGVGASLTRRNLRRAPKRGDKSRTAKLTAKNNAGDNYVTAATACLRPVVQMDPECGVPITEQLRTILRRENVKLIDLFREWDEDGNGGLDKKELRRGVAALGYKVSASEIDAVFDAIDADAAATSGRTSAEAGGNSYIEFGELKAALSDRKIKEARDAADARAIAAGKKTPSQIRKEREAAGISWDEDVVSPSRFALPSLGDVKQQQLASFLAMNNIKVIELFREWDEDGNGMLDKAELRRAVKTLGYQADPKDCDALFDTIDESGDGHVDFDEMKRALNSFLKGRMPTPRAASRGSFSGISPPGTPGRQQSMANFADLARNNARVVLSNLPAVEDAGELVVEPHGEHTHTVVLCHPEASTAEGVYGRLDRRFLPMAEHCKFVFPRVPQRDGSPFWFLPPRTREGKLPAMHFYIQPDDAEADAIAAEQIKLQTERLHAILEREAACLGGDCGRIFVGGTAQGGSVALHAAMRFRCPLGALLCLRTAPLLKFTQANERNNTTPVFIFAGGRDSVCPLPHQQEAFGFLSKAGYKLEWHVETGLGHTSESLNEQRYIAFWVARASLGGAKAVDVNAINELRAALVKKKEQKGELAWSLSPRPFVARPGTMMGGLPEPGRTPGGGSARGSDPAALPGIPPLSANEARVPHPPMDPSGSPMKSVHGPNTARGRTIGELPHTHSANRSSKWAGKSTFSPDSRQKVSYTTDAEMLYPLPGTKSFIRGLRRATAQGAYIPFMYLEPAQAATPHRAARVGVHPLNRQPEWRSWELYI